MNVYLYQNNTEKILKNIYIGEYGWSPGANTIAYYPLTENLNDYSSSGYNLTNSNVVIGTYHGVNCAYFNGNSYATNSSVSNGTTRTLSAWVFIEINKTSNMGVICTGDTSSSFVGLGIYSGKGYITDWRYHDERGTISVLNGRHLITATISNGTTMLLYTDGEQNASYNFSRSSGNSITLGARTGSWTEKLTGYVSNVILENKARTADEVSDYYNQTKSNYGL